MASRLITLRMTRAHATLIFGLIGIALSKYVFIEEFKSTVFDTDSISMEHEVINRTFLNINLTVHKVHNVKVLCGLRIKKFANQKMKNILSWSNVDFCKFLNTYENNIFFGVFRKIFTATYLKSCPIKEGFYFINQVYIDDHLIGLILSRGVYLVRVDASLLDDGIVKLMTVYMRITIP